MQPGEVDDGVLEETDIVEAVRGMRGVGVGGIHGTVWDTGGGTQGVAPEGNLGENRQCIGGQRCCG